MSDAMQSCNKLSEFKDKIGNLNEKCANALIKNKYLMRKVFYDEMKEIVRVNTANRILEKESGCATALDLASMVSEIEINCNIKISMDESNRKLIDSWKQLEDIEVYENAEVPSQYKNKMMESAAEDKERLKEKVADLEKNNESWQLGWRLKAEVVIEHRHIRLLPYKTEHIQEQLQKYKSIVNR